MHPFPTPVMALPAFSRDAPGQSASGGVYLSALGARLVRFWPLFWGALVALLVLGAAGRAADWLLWHDELFTLYASRAVAARPLACARGRLRSPAASQLCHHEGSGRPHRRGPGRHAASIPGWLRGGLPGTGAVREAPRRCGRRHGGSSGPRRHHRVRIRLRGQACTGSCSARPASRWSAGRPSKSPAGAVPALVGLSLSIAVAVSLHYYAGLDPVPAGRRRAAAHAP